MTRSRDLSSLAARICTGDSGAEEEFVHAFQGRIKAFALANGADPQTSDDLVQEVLWGVIRALRDRRVQQPEQLAGFVWGTARNLLRDRLRMRARDKTTSLAPSADFPRPAREQHEFERNHAAQQAIAMLEPHEREVPLLSLVDGLGPEEIADRLGILPDAVRQRKSRAMRKLSELLARRGHR